MAYAVPVLQRVGDCTCCRRARRCAAATSALIAAGTGLGEALLHNVDGRFVPSPSEGGHADFAARTEREIALARDLTARYGRADVEHVVSGRGLVNIHRVAHRQPCAARRRSRRARRAGRHLRGGARRGAAPAAWRRSTCSSRRTAPRPATSRCASVVDRRRVRRRRHRAEDSAGARPTGAFMRAFRDKAAARPDAVARCR